MKLPFLLILIFASTAVCSAEHTFQPYEYKNQKQSAFNWGDIALKPFLSFKEWRMESDVKEQTPEWEQAYRARKNREIVGRFFQCVGTCHVERGEGFFNPSFRSNLYENDEIQTIGESYAWIFLMDGTMVRLSPESSVTINEFNLGQNENFINARINMGNVLWMSRYENFHEENNYRETDVLFFPLEYYDATPTTEHKKYNENELLVLTEPRQTTSKQIEKLNQLIEDNDLMTDGKKTFSVLTLPNVTLMGRAPVVEMVALLGGKSYFRKRTLEEQELVVEPDDKENELQYQLRGYENKEIATIDSDNWMEADEKGRAVSPVTDTNLLNIGSFITKRIPSILVARELLLQRYSNFIFQDEYDRLALAKKEGYRLWEQTEMDLRLDFIKEYFRRIETTNLFSSARFTERMKARGHKIPSTEYNTIYFKKALESLYLSDPYTEGLELAEPLNSTKKTLWKMKHGIK